MVFVGPDNPLQDLPDRLECFTTTGNESNYTHSVAIYVDQPVAGIPATHDSKEKGGHTWIGISQLKPNGEITTLYVGFYPEGKASPLDPQDPGAFSEDENRVYDVSMTWGVTSSQFNQLINHLSTYTTPPDYDLNSFNCTTFAVNELTNIGIQLPQNTSSWTFGGGLNPGRLGQDIRNIDPLPLGADRNTSGGQTPESTCQ